MLKFLIYISGIGICVSDQDPASSCMVFAAQRVQKLKARYTVVHEIANHVILRCPEPESRMATLTGDYPPHVVSSSFASCDRHPNNSRFSNRRPITHSSCGVVGCSEKQLCRRRVPYHLAYWMFMNQSRYKSGCCVHRPYPDNVGPRLVHSG